MLRLVENAEKYAQQRAIMVGEQSFTYQQLLEASEKLANVLLAGQPDLVEQRVAFMVSPGFDYVTTQWAIWRAGGIAVPLCISYPLPSLQYVLEDTQASIVVADAQYEAFISPLVEQLQLSFVSLQSPTEAVTSVELPTIEKSRRAMILYTSGTTNLPKGVVTTHHNLEAQISTLVDAWQWSSDDHILCVLPLHHVHGIINVISCALWSGATCEFLPQFTAEGVLSLFNQGKINVFMAVPTIYFKLISALENLNDTEQQHYKAVLQKFRLMVSGSAALPVSVMEKWEKLSGHRLLERYGMTEIGMAISNPYAGERKAGYIGQALPGVEVRLVDEQNQVVPTGEAGEIQIKGANVFLEYWNKAEATQKSFTNDGWFKTGDVAVVEENYYRILGRDSIDIIKSGGYKISALEIEEILRTHPSIADCSVVGVPSEEWGELVAAALIVKQTDFDSQTLHSWLRERMPAYKTPRKYLVVNELPRNAMGKVTKNDLKKLF